MPVMTTQEARYDRIAEGYAEWWSPVHRPATLRLLDVLAKHNVKATFFMVGKMATTYPDVARKVLAAGHTIGSAAQWVLNTPRAALNLVSDGTQWLVTAQS